MSHNNRAKTLRKLRIEEETNKELESLLDVGTALSAEHESTKVLQMILDKATENTNADGGSIYLIEKVKQDSFGGTRPAYKPVLRFCYALNHSFQIPVKNEILEIDGNSIAGYVAGSGQSVRVRDAYCLTPDSQFRFNAAVDKDLGYRTKSVLAVPIKTNKGRILGVVQLVNKKRSYRRQDDDMPASKLEEKEIIAFSEHDDKLMHAFASHAAVALENAKLTEDINKLFESFVTASVSAIEARDPSTSGHSDRVATLTVKLAEVVDRIDRGPFAQIKFSQDHLREIRYASLLHDFGKIGVREAILVKGQKLFPHELETVLLRMQTISAISEARTWRQCAESMAALIEQKQVFDPKGELGRSLWSIDTFKVQLEKIRRSILKANESQVLEQDFDIEGMMKEIKKLSDDIGQRILTDNEVVRLSVKRGTLSPEERTQIESHVALTYEFLSRIAWTDQLQSVPDIAHAHHEKLDGTGYPRRLRADQIPVQSRMMTIADIYDALTAFDRPYKKAVDNIRALDILKDEARMGKIDKNLLDIFIEAKVFDLVVPARFKKAG